MDCTRTLDSAHKYILNTRLQGLSTHLFQQKSKLLLQKSHHQYLDVTRYNQKECFDKF